jgi:hypothetical protein
MPISLVEHRIRSEFEGARLAKSSASTTWDRGTGPPGWKSPIVRRARTASSSPTSKF